MRLSHATVVAALIATPVAAQVHRSPPAWARSAVIYEVNVRQYTPAGTFAAFRANLSRLKALGVDVLWFMPIQRIGVAHRKGSLGSYYSIADYRAVNPEFGTLADFKALVDDAHGRGMRVMLDWVANHTAFDHVWTTRHPDWYLHRADGSISNAVDESGKETDWTDVAQLDYSNSELRRAMIDEMRWWLTTTGIDGFRCDFAAGVPLDFWVDARRELTSVRPDLFMLAEAESPGLGEAFDATYGWELYHLLNDVAEHKKGTNELEAYIQRQDRAYRSSDFRMYFTSNHDENSWSGTEFERMGVNHRPAFILDATMRGSLLLLYTGQEASLAKRLRFFDKDTVTWNGASLADFYGSVFALKHSQQALWNGAWGGAQTALKTDGGNQVYAFTRDRAGSAVVVAVNFGDSPVSVRYSGLVHTGAYIDWFSKSDVSLASTGRLDIPAHGYRVLVRGADRGARGAD